MRTIPTDSADVRDQAETEAALVEAEQRDQRVHAERCHDGWLGEDHDGRPVACSVCRPHLLHAPCRTCSTTYTACATQQAQRRGPCCDRHDHARRTRGPAR